MEINDFKILLAVQKTDSKIADHMKEIEEEKKRILNLQHKQVTTRQELNQMEKELQEYKAQTAECEKNLYQTENQITKSREHLNMATSEQQANAVENELAVLTQRAQQLESNALELMDKNETLEVKIKESTTFLAGLMESTGEITTESDHNIKQAQTRIQDCENQIQELFKECPVNIRKTFMMVNERFRFKNPLAFIVDGVCNQCHNSVGRNMESTIEKGAVLEFCPHCGRILTPHAAGS